MQRHSLHLVSFLLVLDNPPGAPLSIYQMQDTAIPLRSSLRPRNRNANLRVDKELMRILFIIRIK